jgi:hypothetical protein
MPVGSTLIASAYDTSNKTAGQNYQTPSVTPANGTILTVDTFLAAAADVAVPIVSGLSLTWNTILTELDGGRSAGCFWALVSGSPTGALTITNDQSLDPAFTACGYFVRENTGCDTTTPIFQFKLAGGDGSTSTTPTVTLDNNPSGRTNNRVLMAVQHRLNAATTPRTNWVEPTNGGILADVNGASPNSGFECQWRNDGTNEATASATIGSARYIIWAYELAAATAAAPLPRRRSRLWVPRPSGRSRASF